MTETKLQIVSLGIILKVCIGGYVGLTCFGSLIGQKQVKWCKMAVMCYFEWFWSCKLRKRVV